MPGTLVIAEVIDGSVSPASFELLGAARKLADEGAGPVAAFVAGGDAQAQELIAHGADTVYTSSADPSSLAEVLLPAVDAAIEQSGATIVLIAQSSLGRDLGPLLAFKHNTGVAMDSTEVKVENGRLRATRSAYGGNARAEHTWKSDPQIATLKAKSHDPLEADSSRSGDIKAIDAVGEARIRVLSTEKAESTGIRLEDAPIVVAGGRGLGDASGFELLEQLAGTLPSAAVAASRAACDLGWFPPALQVGLTGKTVSPNVYIAVAISGASQHMAGMAGSKNVVSINKDADANMVKVSKFAVIEDYKKIIPALIEEIKKLG
ncbi:MAG: electron transfer flavoprotein subunit alpha/FixB family protein [Dehalococcoidia bacterium]|nr:electron transfer flavoprotein subunit alpha/FixB family protein [Dehalococcoidia bacterium]